MTEAQGNSLLAAPINKANNPSLSSFPLSGSFRSVRFEGKGNANYKDISGRLMLVLYVLYTDASIKSN